MKTNIINSLDELRPHSNKRLPQATIDGFKGKLSSDGLDPVQLTNIKMISSTNYKAVPENGVDSLLQLSNRQVIRKVLTFESSVGGNYMYRVNTALLGGESYPILNLFLGTVAGLASGGAGLIFSVATTAIDMSKKSQRVLARNGDEIWQVEEIGKIVIDGEFKAIHVNSYFLADPYRGHANGKGWLIHEERTELILE